MSAIDPELEEYMEDVISHCTHVHALASTSGYGGKALSRIKAEPFAPTSPFQSRCKMSYEYDGRERGPVGMAKDGALMRMYNVGLETICSAAEQGNETVVIAHLEAGWPINQQGPRGWTVLHHASLGGSGSVVDALLHRGADTSIGTDEGKSALHIARRWKRQDVITSLIDHGADAHITDADGGKAFNRR